MGNIHFADPSPGMCSACFSSTEEPLVDFDAAYDGAVVIDPDTGLPVVWANGEPATNDDLVLCKACITAAAELLAFSPQRDAIKSEEIRRLRIENEHWRERTRSLTAQLKTVTDAQLGDPVRRGPGRPRKVAA